MATRRSTIDAVLDQLAGAGPLTALKMFGEYCLYLDGTPVGLIFIDRLYVKPTPPGWEFFPDATGEPPFPRARPYLLIPADVVDQWACRDVLCQLLRITSDALPPPKARRRRAASG